MIPKQKSPGSNDVHVQALLLRLIEISKIRRRLVLLGGHQKAVGAQVVVFVADDDLAVAFGAGAFAPGRAQIRIAPKRLVDAPRPRQRVIEDGDLVMEDVRIVLVEMETLLEDGLIVEV